MGSTFWLALREELVMYGRNNFRHPERKASVGFPVGIMVASMLVIAVYLLVGNAFLDSRSPDVAVYVPAAETKQAAEP